MKGKSESSNTKTVITLVLDEEIVFELCCKTELLVPTLGPLPEPSVCRKKFSEGAARIKLQKGESCNPPSPPGGSLR